MPDSDQPEEPHTDWSLEAPAYLGRPRPIQGRRHYYGISSSLQGGCFLASVSLAILGWGVTNREIVWVIIGAVFVVVGVGGWFVAVRNEMRHRGRD